MQPEEQVKICKAIARSCMWGQGGIASVIIDRLDASVPAPAKWRDVYSDNKIQAEHEAVGIVRDRGELDRLLSEGYQIYNYKPGECSIHSPSRFGGGLYKYLIGELAEEYGERFDNWNFNVYKRRQSSTVE